MASPYRSHFSTVVDQLVEDVQANCGRRRLGDNDLPKLRASVAKLVTDSVAITKGRKQKRWASIHKMAGHYTVSRYHNPEITYRIHVERAYDTLIRLQYLTEVKAGVYSDTNRYLTRYEATDKLIDLFADAERVALHESAPQPDNTEMIRIQLRDDEGRKYLQKYDDNDNTVHMRK